MAMLESESDLFKDSLKPMVDHLTTSEVDVNGDAAWTLGADLRFDVATEVGRQSRKRQPDDDSQISQGI